MFDSTRQAENSRAQGSNAGLSNNENLKAQSTGDLRGPNIDRDALLSEISESQQTGLDRQIETASLQIDGESIKVSIIDGRAMFGVSKDTYEQVAQTRRFVNGEEIHPGHDNAKVGSTYDAAEYLMSLKVSNELRRNGRTDMADIVLNQAEDLAQMKITSAYSPSPTQRIPEEMRSELIELSQRDVPLE
jgi:hypothetical protein